MAIAVLSITISSLQQYGLQGMSGQLTMVKSVYEKRTMKILFPLIHSRIYTKIEEKIGKFGVRIGLSTRKVQILTKSRFIDKNIRVFANSY